MSPLGTAAAVAVAVTGAALAAAAVWWYNSLPHVRKKKRLRDREGMIQRFRKGLPLPPPASPPGKPPEE